MKRIRSWKEQKKTGAVKKKIKKQYHFFHI